MVMLLLFTRLFSYRLTQPESDIVPKQPNFNESGADSEQHSCDQMRSAQKTEEIRHLKQAYHLERRLFM
ncbi:radical SAM protein [Microcoleus sp. LEGE 07076]|nr:radical SAM protein [Microcoleus sp. LEGE 07076]